MLGFAPLSATPLSALPIAGSSFAVETLGVVSKFGTPSGIWNQFCDVSGFAPVQFGTPADVWDQFCDVSGFAPVQFGTPTHRRTQPVEGFAPVQFGTPTGYMPQRVEGFAPVQFGAPRLFPFHVGPGIHPVQLGAVTGWQHWNEAATTPSTRLGTPATRTDRTQVATGLRVGSFGTPLGTRRNPPNITQRGAATGFTTTRLGAPRAGWLQPGQATGFTSAHLGTPNGVRAQRATGFATGQFGTTVMTGRAHAAGFSPTRLGMPISRITLPAFSATNTIRWGLASADRSRTYKTYSFASTRLGHPTGFSRVNYPATGFAGGHLGAPTCHQRHRILAIPPCGRFGTPLLKRITQC